MRALTTLAATAVTFAASAVTVVALAPAASADPAVAGTYNPLPVERIVNTTTGVGAAKAVLGAGKSLTFNGLAGLDMATPAALDLTITAIAPATNGFLTAYSGATRPDIATLTFTRGESTPNDAAVRLVDGQSVTIYNGSTGTVDLAVDRNGYWTGGEYPSDDVGLYHPDTPTRVADSRTTKTPVASRTSVAVPLTALDLPASATTVVANVTAVTPGANGYLTSFAPEDASGDRVAVEPAPGTTTVSFTAARTRSNLAIVERDATGGFRLYNGAPVPVDYTVDVLGYFTSGENGDTSAPSGTASFFQQRFADSRQDGGPIAAKGTAVVSVEAPAYVQTITVNVTATGATAPGYLTAWNGTDTRPVSSVTNFTPKVSRTGTVTVPITAGGFTLYNGSTGPVSYTVDIVAFTVVNVPPSRAQAQPAGKKWVAAVRHAR